MNSLTKKNHLKLLEFVINSKIFEEYLTPKCTNSSIVKVQLGCHIVRFSSKL